MARRIASLIVNVLVAVTVFAAWAQMARFVGADGRLSAAGLGSLKYFTVLSNLLEGFVAVFWSIHLIRALRDRAVRPGRLLCLCRYAAVVSVALTFTTVMVFLGPVFGFGMMFTGANFWFHLVVPLAAMLDFCVLDRECAYARRDARAAIVPTVLYGFGYAGNLLINGVGEWPHTNDWYGFAMGGPALSVLVFFGIILGTWGLALLLRLPRRKV